MRLAALIRLTVVAVLGTGVVCQFVQHTDPVFPLWYFTVDSALLAALAAAFGLQGMTESVVAAMVRGAAATGVILSGLVYAAVIAPSSPSGTWFQSWDDPWVRTSTVLLHGVGPVLVVADYLTHSTTVRPSFANAIRWCTWPISYLAAMLVLQALGAARIPYTFLQPSTGGGLVGVGGASVGVAVIFVALARLLQALHGRLTPRAHRPDAAGGS